MKIVEVYGLLVDVPYWANYIAVDEDGTVAIYEHVPESDEIEFLVKQDSRQWSYADIISNEKDVDQHIVDNWQQSLVKIDDLKIEYIPDLEKL